jgi:polysaccharide export outer membrane protein
MRKVCGSFFLFFIALALGSTAHGQQTDSLLIGPGDLLHIVVFDSPELEQHPRVTDSGFVPLLVGGSIKVASLSPEQAARAIEKAFLDQHLMLHPQVSVTVEQYATQNVSVIGDVRLPGAYPIITGHTVEEVLALAGGLMPDADHNVSIERRIGNQHVSYYVANAVEAKSKDAVQVYPGDVVRVARAELVFAIGDLGKPGGFPVINNDQHLTVLQLVAMAGGLNKTAAIGRVRLVRTQPDGSHKETKIPLNDIQKGKKTDIALQANDVLYVPFSYMRNTALGVTGVIASTSSAAIYVTH